MRAIIAGDGDESSLEVIVGLDSGDTLGSGDGGQSWGAAPPAEAQALSTLMLGDGPLIATAQGMARWTGAHPPAPGADVLALLAGKQETLIAAIADGTTLMRSDDGGASWQRSTFVTPLQGAITVFAPASYHMDICWAGTDAGQLLRSDDRGRIWAEVAREPVAIRALAVLRLI